jgi:hypothetical protein
MSSTKTPTTSAAQQWRELWVRALCDAVPCVMADVHRIIAVYVARRFVDWEPKVMNKMQYDLREAISSDAKFEQPTGLPPALDEKRAELLIAADNGVSMLVRSGSTAFSWMAARSTLGESGLRRWSIRLHSNLGASQVVGLTRHTHATLSTAAVMQGNGPVNCSDADTLTFGNWFADWQYKERSVQCKSAADPISAAHDSADTGQDPPYSRIDEAASAEGERRGQPLCPLRMYRHHTTSGLTFTFEADVEANTVRAQLHVPNAALAQQQKLLAPSEVLVMTLPKHMPLSDFRPVVMLWGPGVYVDADPEPFPRFAPSAVATAPEAVSKPAAKPAPRVTASKEIQITSG